MFKWGHMGLTSGLASAVSAYWVRKRIKELLKESAPLNSIFDRVRRRSKFALAAFAFTGCATVVSGSIDSVEKRLGYEHRTAGHSIPILSGLVTTAKLAKRAAKKAVEWVSERVGYSDRLAPVIDELEELASWVMNGGAVGYLSHVLGDLPTMGNGGFAALKLFYPISKRRFNLRIVSAGSKLFNKIFTVIGAFVAASSWAVIGAHLISPDLPGVSVKSVFSSLKTIAWKAITGGLSSLLDATRENLARIENVLRDAWTTAGSGLRTWGHRVRVTIQHALGSPRDDWYPNSNPTI